MNIDLVTNHSTWGGTNVSRDGEHNGNAAFKVVSTSNNGAVQYVPNWWDGFSLRDYEPNGVIEFYIKGEAGGETFVIGLKSKWRNKEVTKYTSSTDLGINVTNRWTHHKVPVKKLAEGASEGFTIDNITEINFRHDKPQTYHISQLYITSPDNERQYAVIKPNQVGYAVNDTKYAMVSAFSGRGVRLTTDTRFDVINVATAQSVFNGRLTHVKNNDNYSGENVYKASFDRLRTEGEYVIRIDGIADSYPFAIKKDVYAEVMVDALRYFYFQRQGIELLEEHAGIFAREDLHPEDSEIKLYSQKDETNAPVFDMSGGWYDAGDFGKYVTPGAAAASHLLFAYELFPQLFFDEQQNIPESGNGLPDILSEAKFELDWILKMEKGTTGGFYDLIPDPGMLPNWATPRTRYIMDVAENNGRSNPSTNASINAAAVLAQAYIVFKDISGQKDYAATCLAAAKRAWDFVKSQGTTVTRGTGSYATDDVVEINEARLWAAGVLFRATGEREYGDYFKNNHEAIGKHSSKNIFNAWATLPGNRAMDGYFHYLLSPNADKALLDYFKQNFVPYRNLLFDHYNNNGWGVALPDWAFWWGSTGTNAMLTPVTIYIGNKILGELGGANDKSVEMARGAVNYKLGANPLAFSFVSGHGTDSIKNIFSTIYDRDGIDEIPPGYVPGGASSYNYTFTHFPAKAYSDSDTNYTVNENAIYWNSAFVFCLALVMATAGE
jgi:hypothetical protein